MRRAAEARAKRLRDLERPTPRGWSHGAAWHALGASLLHLGKGVEPGGWVLFTELLDLEWVLF